MSFYQTYRALAAVPLQEVRRELALDLISFACSNGSGTFDAKNRAAAETYLTQTGVIMLAPYTADVYSLTEPSLIEVLRRCGANKDSGNLLYTLPEKREDIRNYLHVLISGVTDKEVRQAIVAIFGRIKRLMRVRQRHTPEVGNYVLSMKLPPSTADFLCAAGVITHAAPFRRQKRYALPTAVIDVLHDMRINQATQSVW